MTTSNCCGFEGTKNIRYISQVGFVVLACARVYCPFVRNMATMVEKYCYPIPFGFHFSFSFSLLPLNTSRHRTKNKPSTQWKHPLNEPKINESYRFHSVSCLPYMYRIGPFICRKERKSEGKKEWEGHISFRILISVEWRDACDDTLVVCASCGFNDRQKWEKCLSVSNSDVNYCIG